MSIRPVAVLSLFAAATLVLTPVAASAQPTELAGHDEAVYSAAYTPDGKWIVTVSFDETLRLWNAKTGEAVRTMTGHQGLVVSVAVSADGSRIASGGLDRTIKLWDVPTPDPTGQIVENGKPLAAVAVSKVGKWYAFAGDDKVVRLWNVETGKVEREITGHEHPVTELAFRPDGQQLASADASGVVRTFNPADGTALAVVGAHAGPVTGLAYAPNGSLLVSAGQDGYVRRWPNQFPAARQVVGHTANVTRVRISPSGARLVSASDDKTVRLWNFADGKPLKTLDGHGSRVTTVAFTYNSAQVATGCDDKIARLFDANNGNLVKAFPAMPDRVTAVAVHPNNQEIAVGDAKGNVKVFKTADATEVRALVGHTAAVTGLVYTPNQSQLVSASADKSVRVWAAADGSEQRKLDLPTPLAALAVSGDSARLAVGGDDKVVRTFQIGDGKPLLELAGHAGKITDVEFSRDNQRIVAASDDGIATVWDRNTKLPLQHFPLPKGAATASFHTDHRTVAYAGAAKEIEVATLSATFAHVADEKGVNDLAVSSNSAYHLTAGESGTVKMWNLGNGTLTREFAGPTAAVTGVGFTPNAAQVAAGARDKSLYVWNLSGQMQYEVKSPVEIERVAFSPDGKKLVAVGSDQTIRSYDPAPPNPQPEQPLPREVAQELVGHEKSIRAAVFTADNRTLLTAGDDGSLKTWAVAAAGQTANLTGHGDAVYGLAFTPDGNGLVSTSNDKTVRLWDLEKNQIRSTLSPQQNGTHYGTAVTRDGRFAFAAGTDKTVRLWNLSTQTQIRRFTGPEHQLYDVAVSPDGKTVAAGGMGLGSQRPVYLWNVDAEKPTRLLEGHADDCYAVEFNAAGNRLLTAGYSGQVFVWNVGSGKPVFETDLGQVVYSATLSPDGTRIAVSAADGKVHLVDVPAAAR